MSAHRLPQRIHSLADAAENEYLKIGSIPFWGIRYHCAVQSIEPGDVVQCIGRSDAQLLLRTAAGVEVALDTFLARFVEADEVSTPLAAAR